MSESHVRNNEALRKSEQRYRVLFDLSPVAVYSIDASGVIPEFNRGFDHHLTKPADSTN